MLGSKPVSGEPIKMNGAVYIFCGILKFVVASAAEYELGALFLNANKVKLLHIALHELGHTQPRAPMHCDNVTAIGIASDTIKKQQPRSM